MQPEDSLYCSCGRPATWIRRMQVYGDQGFCSEHAKEEPDFVDPDPSYFFWDEIPPEKIAQKHKTWVDGYEDNLQRLCEQIHRMRYDEVGKFYEHAAHELRQQAAGDRAAGRNQLAGLLEEAANTAEQQRKQFERIWALCEPHMNG